MTDLLTARIGNLCFWDYSYFLNEYEPEIPAKQHIEEWQKFVYQQGAKRIK